MRDQRGPVQGKDSMSLIEAQDEAVWTFMCVAIGKCDKMFFGSSSPSFHVSLPGAAPPEFNNIALVPVQWEQCQNNVSMVPAPVSAVSEEFVSVAPVHY